jgi:hypothetical protein
MILADRSLDRSEAANAARVGWREAKQAGGLRPASEGAQQTDQRSMQSAAGMSRGIRLIRGGLVTDG